MPKEPKKVFVKPAPGCMVHYEPPMPGFLKPEGEWVSLTTYWLRRIRMVDVVECEPGREQAAKAAAEAHDVGGIITEDAIFVGGEKVSDIKRSEKGKGKK